MTRSTRGIVRMAALAVAVMLGAAGPVAQTPAERRDHHEARERWQKVEAILDAMAAGPGAVVADVGAGGGFFTTRLSRAVGPAGRVLAVDIDTDVLGRLRALVSAESLANVDVITGAPDDPRLPAGTLDAVLIVNAYHEMTAYAEILPKLRAALKPAGRLVIVEPISGARRGRPRAEQTARHEIDVDYVLAETRAAGFRPLRLEDPFTTRPGGHGEEWLLVLTHGPVVAPLQTTPAAPPPTDHDASQLRVRMDEFDALVTSGNVLVFDVRGDDGPRRGHLPGAI
jgi:predicted methyltransferase